MKSLPKFPVKSLVESSGHLRHGIPAAPPKLSGSGHAWASGKPIIIRTAGEGFITARRGPGEFRLILRIGLCERPLAPWLLVLLLLCRPFRRSCIIMVPTGPKMTLTRKKCTILHGRVRVCPDLPPFSRSRPCWLCDLGRDRNDVTEPVSLSPVLHVLPAITRTFTNKRENGRRRCTLGHS